MTMRPEKPADRSRIATLIARTYGAQGAEILRLTSKMRELDTYTSELCVVAQEGDEIAAFAFFTPLDVGDTKDAALMLAPFAFDAWDENATPDTHLEGAVTYAREKGYAYVMLLGKAADYRDAGYVPAEELGLEHECHTPGARLLAKSLQAQETPTGRVILPEMLR